MNQLSAIEPCKDIMFWICWGPIPFYCFPVTDLKKLMTDDASQRQESPRKDLPVMLRHGCETHWGASVGNEFYIIVTFLFVFQYNFCVKPYVPREPWWDPSNRRLYEHGIWYISDTVTLARIELTTSPLEVSWIRIILGWVTWGVELFWGWLFLMICFIKSMKYSCY